MFRDNELCICVSEEYGGRLLFDIETRPARIHLATYTSLRYAEDAIDALCSGLPLPDEGRIKERTKDA